MIRQFIFFLLMPTMFSIPLYAGGDDDLIIKAGKLNLEECNSTSYASFQRQILSDNGFEEYSIEKAPIYKCSHPIIKVEPLIVFGTDHGLPLTLFSLKIRDFLVSRDEIYLESDKNVKLFYDKHSKDYCQYIPQQNIEKIQEILKIFGFDSDDLTHIALGSLAGLLLNGDYAFGMDTTLFAAYRMQEKPVYNLDKNEFNSPPRTLENIIDEILLREKPLLQLQEDFYHSEKNQQLFGKDSEEMLNIKRSIDSLRVFITEIHGQSPAKPILEYCINLIESEKNNPSIKNDILDVYLNGSLKCIEEPLNDKGLPMDYLAERNARWLEIIKKSYEDNPETKKLFAFGFDHLYDILLSLTNDGFQIERMNQDGVFEAYTLEQK